MNARKVAITTTFLAFGLLAQANPWWERPLLMGSVSFKGQKGDGGPYHVGVDAEETYVSFPQSMALDPVSLYRWDDAANGVFDNPVNIISNALLTQIYPSGQLRGAAVSAVHGRQLIGSYAGPYVLSVPLEPMEEAILDNGVADNPNVFAITNSLGITLDSFFFSKDGHFLYSSAQGSAYRNKVFKFAVGNLEASGAQLTAINGGVYDFGARIRNAAFATIDGHELYYALLDGTNGVKVLDLDTGVISPIVSFQAAATYGAISVVGAATHTPRLYVLPSGNHLNAPSSTGDLTIYELDPTGKVLAGTAPHVFTKSEISTLSGVRLDGANGLDITVSDDESVLLVCANDKIAAIRYQPEVRIFNVGAKADLQTQASGLIRPGSTISCRLTNRHRAYTPFAYIDGKPAEIDQDGRFFGVAGATADIVVIYAWRDAWYSTPVLKNKVVVNDSMTYSPWCGFLDEENGRYFASISCNDFGGIESGLAQIDAAKLIKSRRTGQEAVNWTMSMFESGDETFRDLAYSPEFGVVLSSGFSGYTNKVVAYPLGGSWTNGEDRYFVPNDLGRRLWPAAFGHGSQFLYAVHSTGATPEPTGGWINDTVRPALGKFRSVTDGSGKLVSFEFGEDIVTNNLPHIGDYACYVGVVRTYRDPGSGREIVYVAGQDGVTAVDLSTTPPTIVRNWFRNVGKYDETYPSLNIIGAGTGTPHLVLNRSTTGLSVYGLLPDLMTLASPDPIAAYKKTSAPFSTFGLGGNAMAFCGFGATADEKYIFFNAPTDGTKFTTLLISSERAKNASTETMIIFR